MTDAVTSEFWWVRVPMVSGDQTSIEPAEVQFHGAQVQAILTIGREDPCVPQDGVTLVERVSPPRRDSPPGEFQDEVIWATSTTGDDFQCVHVDFAREQQEEIKRLREQLAAVPVT